MQNLQINKKYISSQSMNNSPTLKPPMCFTEFSLNFPSPKKFPTFLKYYSQAMQNHILYEIVKLKQ